MERYHNVELALAVNKALNTMRLKANIVGHGIKCIACSDRNCRSLTSGKYKCMSCSEEFYFSDWYRKVNGITTV